MNWDAFKRHATELAEAAERLFDRTGVLLVGTIRKDGSPRISPVEPIITEGNLYLGMMWRSLKALDLLRDPRCTVHNVISDRMAAEGEFKLHGRASEVRDLEERGRFRDALYRKIGWKPEEPNYHLFSVDVSSAGYFTADGDVRVVKIWREGEEVREMRQTEEDVNPTEDRT
jgi:hypothetical protein